MDLPSLPDIVANAQFGPLVAAIIVVVAGVLIGRRWYVYRANGGHTFGVLLDALAVIAPYFAGLAIVGVSS